MKENGFKQGVNNLKEEGVEEQKEQRANSKQPVALQSDNDLKYNSPETDPNSKR